MDPNVLSLTYLNRKKWEINAALVSLDSEDESLTLIDIVPISPTSYDKADLIIPPRSLAYGVYKLRFYSRMWDENPEDPNWTHKLPFERDAYSYIEIIGTPLVARLLDGDLSYVTRGTGQILNLEPKLYSYDPDFPDEEV